MVDRNHFQAYGAAVTSSRMGVPSYWLQSDQVAFEDIPEPVVEPLSGQPETDPVTGETRVNHQLRTRSFNNFVYLSGIPVLYWPVLSTDLTKPTFYINNLQLTNDNVFGTQVQAELDPYQLLGISDPPEGTEWSWNAAYLSERGFGFGTELSYDSEDLWGIPGTYRGTLDTWGLNDNGLDNLGADRRAVQPESDYRGRLVWQHRQQLPNDLQWTAEIGLVSDRNFLEQYFEPQWDQDKDLTTGMELKQTVENGSWSLAADVQLNDFFTQTETLPRGDHFWLGRSVLFDRATWYEHTHAGYFGIKTANLPTNPDQPAQAFLPWETDLTGNRISGTQRTPGGQSSGTGPAVPMGSSQTRPLPGRRNFSLATRSRWGRSHPPARSGRFADESANLESKSEHPRSPVQSPGSDTQSLF